MLFFPFALYDDCPFHHAEMPHFVVSELCASGGRMSAWSCARNCLFAAVSLIFKLETTSSNAAEHLQSPCTEV